MIFLSLNVPESSFLNNVSKPWYKLDRCEDIKVTNGKNSMSQHFIRTMMTSSNGNIFRVTGHLCGEFTGPGDFPAQRPVTRSFDVFFDHSLNERFSKQSRGWWFETQSRPLWRHCNGRHQDMDIGISEFLCGEYNFHCCNVICNRLRTCDTLMAQGQGYFSPLVKNTYSRDFILRITI